MLVDEFFFWQQEFKGDIYMRQFWKDPRLAYGDKNWTLILQGDILNKMWFPDTYIENAKKTTIHDDTRTVIVFGDGNVFYSVRYNVSWKLLKRIGFADNNLTLNKDENGWIRWPMYICVFVSGSQWMLWD